MRHTVVVIGIAMALNFCVAAIAAEEAETTYKLGAGEELNLVDMMKILSKKYGKPFIHAPMLPQGKKIQISEMMTVDDDGLMKLFYTLLRMNKLSVHEYDSYWKLETSQESKTDPTPVVTLESWPPWRGATRWSPSTSRSSSSTRQKRRPC